MRAASETPHGDAATGDERADRIVPAGIASRIGKFFVGLLQVQAVFVLVTNPTLAVADEPIANAGYYVITGAAILLLSLTVNLGFDRSWGRRPLLVAVALLGVAALVDLALFGRAWGPPVAAILYAVSVYVHGHMGVSHVLAALLGTPGCEMRAIPQLWARLQGRAGSFRPCPGIWTPIDRWEASLRARMSE